jgi:transposase
VPDDPVIEAAVPPAQYIRTETEKEVMRMVCKEGISVRSAAARANIDVATAMTFLAKAGLVISRRPKKLKTAIRQSLIEELKNGADRKILAGKYEVSQSTIAKVLAQEFGLQLAWSSTRSEQMRATARADWQALVTDYPHIGIKQLREKNQKIYAWLYRNDRSWLVDSCRQLATISQPRRPLVDWRTRDLHLANAVLKAAKEIAHETPGAKILLWKLYQRVPQLKTKLSSLHKLPLTKEVIDQLRMDSTNTDADGGLF